MNTGQLHRVGVFTFFNNMRRVQNRIKDWCLECFGERILYNKEERNLRFLEESLELVQAAGMSKTQALQVLDYVYNRPVGELKQEVGGVMVTLSALCTAHELDLGCCMMDEVNSISEPARIEKIRSKQAAKPQIVRG